MAVQEELASHARYTKISMLIAPFFQDDGKLLLSDRSIDELDLLDDPNGQPLSPGSALGTLPPGTRLRIERIEFPTAFVVAQRVIYSPRFNPWVYLVPAEANAPAVQLAHGKPFILVLRPQMTTRDEVLAEVDRYLSRDDVGLAYRALPAPNQEAILHKTLLSGIDPTQVQMAWGYPERIRLDEAQKSQVWIWPSGKQQASFSAGALVRWNDHGTPGGSAAP